MVTRKMARTVDDTVDKTSTVVEAKDFARAGRLYYNDVRPNQSKASEYLQEVSTAFKSIKKDCGIKSMVAKFVFKLEQMEDHEREDALRCLSGLLKEFRMFMPRDLVDAAEGAAEEPAAIVPVEPKEAPRRKPKLVTVPVAPEKGPDWDVIQERLAGVVEPAPAPVDDDDF